MRFLCQFFLDDNRCRCLPHKIEPKDDCANQNKGESNHPCSQNNHRNQEGVIRGIIFLHLNDCVVEVDWLGRIAASSLLKLIESRGSEEDGCHGGFEGDRKGVHNTLTISKELYREGCRGGEEDGGEVGCEDVGYGGRGRDLGEIAGGSIIPSEMKRGGRAFGDCDCAIGGMPIITHVVRYSQSCHRLTMILLRRLLDVVVVVIVVGVVGAVEGAWVGADGG